jgi:uncharacterized protein (TIGR02996 family)
MQAFLANIHAHPDDPGPKLVYATWWDESVNPRAQLIRTREACRQAPADREALARCLNAAADILGVEAERDRIAAYLQDILELRALLVHEADCAARVLCVYEREKQGDVRPRQAIDACRAFAAMTCSVDQLLAAAAAARDAADAVDEPVHSSAVAAAHAAEFFLPYGAASASMTADCVVEMVAGPARAELEAVWQLGRLIDLWLYGWDYPFPQSEKDAL